MATRLYLTSTAGAPDGLTPGFAAWTRTTEGVRRRLLAYKDGSAAASTTIWANGAAAASDSALAVQFISDPLAAGIAFVTSDTIKCYIRCNESGVNDNINRQPICVKVYSQDGTTLQATMLALGHVGPNTTEWINGTLTSKTLADGDTLTTGYTTVSGDRLVIEVGGQVSTAGGTTVTGTMSFGSDNASDLAENETGTTALNPWFEISRTLVFTPPDDSETDVWSGVVPAMAQAALGVFAAASLLTTTLAASFQFNDERPTPAVPVMDEDFPGPLPAPQLWWTPPLQAERHDGNDLAWTPDDNPGPPLRRFENPWVVSRWTPSQGRGTYLPLEEPEGLQPVVPPPIPWGRLPIFEEGDYAPPVTATVEDDAPPVGLVWPEARSGQAATDDGNDLGNLHLFPTVDEDFPGPVAAPLLWPVPPPQAMVDDGNSLGNLHALPTVDEDFTGPLPAPVLWSVPPLQATALEENWVAPPLSIGTDEDHPIVLPAPLLWTVPPPQALTDDGMALGNLHLFPSVDEDFAGPLPRPELWTVPPPQARAIDEDWVTPPTFIGTDEDYLLVLPAPALCLVPPVQAMADSGMDMGNLHLNPAIDEEPSGPQPQPQLSWTPPLQATIDAGNDLSWLRDEDFPGPRPRPDLWPVPPCQAVAIEETWVAPTPTIGTDEDYLLVTPTPALWPVPSVQARLDEGNDLGNLHLNVAVDDDATGWPVVPTASAQNTLFTPWDDPIIVSVVEDDASVLHRPIWAAQSLWLPPPDEDFVPSLAVDEEGWLSPASVSPSNVTMLWWDDGNAVSSLSTVEEHDGTVWPSPRLWPTPPPQAVCDEGLIAFPRYDALLGFVVTVPSLLSPLNTVSALGVIPVTLPAMLGQPNIIPALNGNVVTRPPFGETGALKP